MAWAAAIPAVINAAASIGGGILSRNSGKLNSIEKRKKKLIDQLIEGLGGQGQFANLFAGDEEAFQKSIVDPAKSRFTNQIAPQIQQSYIANGQQRGTGLDDTLTRAGVDMDQLINSQYMDFLNQANQNKFGAINSILGSGSGFPTGQSVGSAAGQGFAGFLSNQDSYKPFMDWMMSGQGGGNTPNTTANVNNSQNSGYGLPNFLDYPNGQPRKGFAS